MSKNKLKSDEDVSGDEDFSEEEDDWDDEEFEDEDEIFDDIVDDELISEMSEERGGWVHLRYRDSLGRFASPDTSPEHKKEIVMNRKIEKFIREYRKKIQLPYNEKILLLRLVDDFRDKENILDKIGFLNPRVSHFKRLLYHKVFLDFSNSHYNHLGRSAFSQFIKRMVKKGLVKKIKHGKKLYLKITKKGLYAVYRFWEEYPGESWRIP